MLQDETVHYLGLTLMSALAERPISPSPIPAAPAAAPVGNPASFLTEVTVEHGPAPLLGRFFLAAETAARENGVTVSFATFDDLLAINERNRDTWRPLVPMFHPRYNTFTRDNSIVLLGRNAQGDVVATQAARLLRLNGTTLYNEAVSLRLHYEHPERDRLPDEQCIVTAEATKAITGTVLLGGAVWYRPDYRKRGLAAILPRVSRAYAYTRWKTDYTTSMMVAGVAKGGVAAASGYTNIEPAIEFKNSPAGDFGLMFVWMQPEALLADLQVWLDGFGSEVDAAVRERRA